MKRIRFDFASRPQLEMRVLEAVPVGVPSGQSLVMLRQDPPMADVDEAVLLLHTAAEIEHALLVQYLYAAYSLDPMTEPQKSWRERLLGIAREEMGHLISVQNILLALGGPLNFEREDYPFREFYPFPFELEPFGLKTAARYVLAEMPDISQVPGDLGFDFVQVQQDAGIATSGGVINRVGLLYERLGNLVGGLEDAAFHRDSLSWQATPQDWGASALNLILRPVAHREAAMALVRDIGAQGEGPSEPAGGSPSHFRRFFALYQELRAHGTQPLSAPLPTNPNTYDPAAPGYLSNENARLWAHLFNLRYRILLAQLFHYLELRGDLQPEKAIRGRLRIWCIEEMRYYLPALASQITQMPQHDPPHVIDGQVQLAGPGFELPYTLNLPSRALDRWRYHNTLGEYSIVLADRISGTSPGQPILDELREWDRQRSNFIQQQISEALPD